MKNPASVLSLKVADKAERGTSPDNQFSELWRHHTSPVLQLFHPPY